MKIIDCFPFFNELMILDLRLHILNPYVDQFVLVEATRSHQDKEKRLFFEENKQKFEKFLPKIKHVVVDDFPPYSYWSHEAHQRNRIIDAIYGQCDDNDVIFISDVDEIWNPEKIVPVLNGISNDRAYQWQSKLTYRYFNLVAQNDPWVQPLFLRYSLLKSYHDQGYKITDDILRNYSGRNLINREVISGMAGWHFSYTEDPEFKLQNFLHSEYASMSNEEVMNCIHGRMNPFHKNIMTKIDDSELHDNLPKHVVDHLGKYRRYIFRDRKHDDLPVTLVGINCAEPQLAIQSLIETSSKLKFDDVIFFSDTEPEHMPEHIRFVKIDRISCIDDYNRFVLMELVDHIESDFCMIVHADGYAHNPHLWNKDFLKHDYIGAPWPDNFIGDSRVGNGRVCIRSKKLMKLVRDAGGSNLGGNEDVIICLKLKQYLLENGCTIAPVDIAKSFSFELRCDDLVVDPDTECFAFHGKSHLGEFHVRKLNELVEKMNERLKP